MPKPPKRDINETAFAVMQVITGEKPKTDPPKKNPAAVALKPVSPVVLAPEPGRNSLCHCGSGKKYKRCHGAR